MNEPRWIEIPADLGAPLWSAYRQHMGGAGGLIKAYACGTYEGYVETQIGTRGGGYYLMRLVTTYDTENRQEADSSLFSPRINERTRYYLPAEVTDADATSPIRGDR